MVSEQWVFQAIAAGKTYDSLPTRIKNTLSFTEWKNKCVQTSHCHRPLDICPKTE